MRYRELGRTGLKVSEIGFGGEWLLGSQEETKVLMDHASAQGINIIDCWMADPRVRANLGAGLAGNRDAWIVQGHIGSAWVDEQYVRTRDMKHVRPAFEDELRLLGTDHFELGMMHYIDDVDEFDRSWNGEFGAYVRDLRDQGIIGHIGMSTHRTETAMRAIDTGEVEMLLFSINPAFDMMPATTQLETMLEDADFSAGGSNIDPARAEMYAHAEEMGVGITVMKPFAGGRMLDAKLSPFGVALTPLQCIHYALNHPSVASVLGGWKDIAQIDEAVSYENAAPEDLDYASVLASAPAHSYSGQCTYCGHCAPCVAGIEINMVNKFFDLATMHDEVPASLQSHYEALGVGADACIACHACEPRCPFGVPIAERMSAAAKLFAR